MTQKKQPAKEGWVRVTLDVGPDTHKALEELVKARESGSKAEVLRSLIRDEHKRLDL